MIRLKNHVLPEGYGEILSSGVDTLDEIFGSDGDRFGFVSGKTYLISAPEGTGKSRFFFSVESLLTQKNPELITGTFLSEQNPDDALSMCQRAGIAVTENMLVTRENQWENIKRNIREFGIRFAVIDSLPMILSSFLKKKDERTGKFSEMTVAQKVEEIRDFGAENQCAMILINHCTKGGAYKGSSAFGHMVDVRIEMYPQVEGYDGIKVVEFHGGKNREGVPVKRAFPFNGSYDFSTCFEVVGKEKQSSGAQNRSKVAERKEMLENNFRMALEVNGGRILREDLDSEKFTVEGMVRSAILSHLRTLVEEGKMKVRRESTGARGTVPIVEWFVPELETETAATA